MNSRFVGTISPVFSVDEAKSFVSQIREKYAKATHNVPVYIVGFGTSMIAHSSDDGEPPGTAGRPALSVLKGSGLGDTAIVITRYFGGTKLGTGGLVKAYSDTARQVIAAVPKSKKILVHHGYLKCHYPLYEKIIYILNQYQGWITDEIFTAAVEIEFTIPVNNFAVVKSKINELSQGKVVPIINKPDQIALIPQLKPDTP
jgi:uncharacterized YigZ family protein